MCWLGVFIFLFICSSGWGQSYSECEDSDYEPICGSDGSTYPNECYMDLRNRYGSDTYVDKMRDGPCRGDAGSDGVAVYVLPPNAPARAPYAPAPAPYAPAPAPYAPAPAPYAPAPAPYAPAPAPYAPAPYAPAPAPYAPAPYAYAPAPYRPVMMYGAPAYGSMMYAMMAPNVIYATPTTQTSTTPTTTPTTTSMTTRPTTILPTTAITTRLRPVFRNLPFNGPLFDDLDPAAEAPSAGFGNSFANLFGNGGFSPFSFDLPQQQGTSGDMQAVLLKDEKGRKMFVLVPKQS